MFNLPHQKKPGLSLASGFNGQIQKAAKMQITSDSHPRVRKLVGNLASTSFRKKVSLAMHDQLAETAKLMRRAIKHNKMR